MKIVRLMSLAAVLALAPLTSSPGQALDAAAACGPDCCDESGSTCVMDGRVTDNAYYSADGCPDGSGGASILAE